VKERNRRPEKLAVGDVGIVGSIENLVAEKGLEFPHLQLHAARVVGDVRFLDKESVVGGLSLRNQPDSPELMIDLREQRHASQSLIERETCVQKARVVTVEQIDLKAGRSRLVRGFPELELHPVQREGVVVHVELQMLLRREVPVRIAEVVDIRCLDEPAELEVLEERVERARRRRRACAQKLPLRGNRGLTCGELVLQGEHPRLQRLHGGGHLPFRLRHQRS
jgi:hypothetical protein